MEMIGPSRENPSRGPEWPAVVGQALGPVVDAIEADLAKLMPPWLAFNVYACPPASAEILVRAEWPGGSHGLAFGLTHWEIAGLAAATGLDRRERFASLARRLVSEHARSWFERPGPGGE